VPVDPDLLFCDNNQCSTVTKWFEVNARHYGVPLFVLDTPFSPAPEHEQSAVDYLTRQFEELIAFVETSFGLRYDEGRLRETLRLSRRAVQLWQEILDLCQARPSPVNTFDLWLHMTPMTLSRGTQQCVDYYEALKAEIEERVREGVAAVPGERIRLLWEDIGMWQRMKELAQKFGHYGGCFVTSTYTDIWLFHDIDPDRPLEGLARASLGLHFNRSLDYRADFIIQRIKKYAVDAVVIHSCRSCKPWFIGSYDLKDIIAAQTGVPTLIFDGDQVDPRFVADDQMYSRIDAFMETLAAKG
jgi:benzoyl-CoA reductase/2-hydroxyglutaryl-CoA dehydratase subunit BcrC/BadD/HgdB